MISSSSLTRATRLRAAKVGDEAAAATLEGDGTGNRRAGRGRAKSVYLQRVKYSGSSGTGKSRLHNRLSLGTGGREGA